MLAGTFLVAHFHHLVHVVVDGLDEHPAAQGFEPVGAVGPDGVVLVGDGVLHEEGEDHVVYPHAVEFYHIIHKYWPVVVVAVEHADVGVDAGLDEGSLYLAVKHTVAIVEQGIGDVHGRMLAAGVETVFLWKEKTQDLKIDFGGHAFPAPEGGRDIGHHLTTDPPPLWCGSLRGGGWPWPLCFSGRCRRFPSSGGGLAGSRFSDAGLP